MTDYEFMNAILTKHVMDTVRYSAPAIVRERCPLCAGSGLRAIGVGPLAKLDSCGACNARGFINREQ